MTETEIETLVNYLDGFSPADMREGTYDVRLTESEIKYIIERINIG